MGGRHLFIAVEGLDGTGKSTITDDLARVLVAAGRPATAIHTPPEGYRAAADYVNLSCDVNSHFLFYLSALAHASALIRRELKSQSVVCDRYLYSTLAYHRARGLSVQTDIASLELVLPDCVFYLTVDDENVRQARIRTRGRLTPGDELGMKDGDLLAKIHEHFLAFDMENVDTTKMTREQVVDSLIKRLPS